LADRSCKALLLASLCKFLSKAETVHLVNSLEASWHA
jgi:hypothetical protein